MSHPQRLQMARALVVLALLGAAPEARAAEIRLVAADASGVTLRLDLDS